MTAEPATKLKEIMEGNYISVGELARRAGKAEKTIRNAIAGNHETRLETKQKIFKALNELLAERDEPPVKRNQLFP